VALAKNRQDNECSVKDDLAYVLTGYLTEICLQYIANAVQLSYKNKYKSFAALSLVKPNKFID